MSANKRNTLIPPVSVMNGSLGTRARISASILLLFTALCGVCTVFAPLTQASSAAAQKTSLSIVDVEPNVPEAIAHVRAAFQKGGTVVRYTAGTEKQLRSLLNLGLDANATVTSDPKAMTSQAVVNHTPLVLRGIAAYKGTDGAIYSVQSFAPADAPEDPEGGWRKGLDDWVKNEQAKAAGIIVGLPSPPGQAWTLLYQTTVQSDDDWGNIEQNSIAAYRLNTIDEATDYYMVYTTPQSEPAWQGTCGEDGCDMHTIGRAFNISSPSSGTALVEHGPTGTITTESGSFSIGATLSPSPGVSAQFGTSWSQPSVTTTDQSGSSAAWLETFNIAEYSSVCHPTGGSLPGVSTGTYYSQQGAIFSVAGGTPSVRLLVRDQATFCNYTTYVNDYGRNFRTVVNVVTLNLSPPVLSATPPSLVIAPGTSRPLLVSAYIPNSPESIAWTISTNKPWLSVPSSGPFSTGDSIPISVAAGTPDGSTGVVSIDSSPVFATPSVEKGPIEIAVTVGQPNSQPAGVLIFGGFTANTTVANVTAVYDPVSKQFNPTENPKLNRVFHSATLLMNGDILIAGGNTSYSPTNEGTLVTAAAELYHPATASFSPTGGMNVGRAHHVATLLPDGKVLITGGLDADGTPLASVELYDPASGTFTSTGSLTTARYSHQASVIAQAGQATKVIVYSGLGQSLSTPTIPSEVWDESTGKFVLGPESTARLTSAAALLPDGQLSVVGGSVEGATAASEDVLTLAGPSFAAGYDLNVARVYHTLTALDNHGALLVTGGLSSASSSLASAELRGPNGWSLLPVNLNEARYAHSATLLPDGTVFLLGGTNDGQHMLSSSDIYDPVSKTFSPGPSFEPRGYHTATLFTTTSTRLTVSPSSPSSFGQSVILSAVIASPFSQPGGTVQFLDGSTVLSTVPVKDSHATFTAAALAVGSHALAAAYSGDGTSSPSTSAVVTQVVNTITTATSLASSINPSDVDQSVTFTAKVTASTGGEVTGTVTFRDGATSLGQTALSKGVATLTLASLSAGTHQITATYSGDADRGTSVSVPVSQVVSYRSTTTTLTSSSTQSTYGQSVSFTAVVKGNSNTPAGTIIFKDGSTILEQVTLSSEGSAVYSTSLLGAGSHSLTAAYSGSQENQGSVSPPLVIRISQAVIKIAINSSSNPSTVQNPVRFSVQVTGSGATPTGTVQFSDGPSPIGGAQPLFGGSANVSTSNLTVGQHSITAAYSGDANYLSGASDVYPQRVSGISTTTSLRPSVNPSYVNQSVTFVAVANSSSGTPTGSVNFLDGSNTLGSAPLNDGVANFTTPGLSAGVHTITAVYSGGGPFSGSTSAPLSQIVNLATTATKLSSSPNPSTTLQTVNFTAQVTSASGIPTGTVTFQEGSTVLGKVRLNDSGVATIASPPLSAGDSLTFHLIEAIYTGGGAFTSSSDKLTQSTSKASSSLTLISSPNPSSWGTAVQFTATVSGQSGSVSPTGTVTFYDNYFGTVLGTTKVINGAATFTTSTLSSGRHFLGALYSGDAKYGGATSSELLQTVGQATTTVTLTSSGNNTVPGQPVTFTANVSAMAGTPTGTVTFKDSATTLGMQVLEGGTTSLIAANLTEGVHQITASYGGSKTFAASTSAVLTQTVNGKFPSSAQLTSKPNPSNYGENVVFTVVITANGNIPTGSVTLSEGDTIYGSAPITNGVAVINIQSLPVGLHVINATYGGDDTHTGATSGSVQQQVNQPTSGSTQ